MKTNILSSPRLTALVATTATLCIASFLVYAASDNVVSFFSEVQPHGSAFTESSALLGEDAPSSRDSYPSWPWTVATAAGIVCVFWYARRSTRKSLAGNVAMLPGSNNELRRLQSADQLRDALAIFNRQAFNRSSADDDLASLHRAFVSARIELQKRNARLMYDAVGASHIQAVQQMLTEMEEDLSKNWPQLTLALKRLPVHLTADDTARFQAETVGTSDYNALMTYLCLLRAEIREELVHAELRYRRLLAA